MSKQPSPDIPGDSDIKTREERLGLVLYGGVSLAIYINGVTQEFFNAVRGRGVYRLIKAITDSDIVVDIISGTSAGGINGLLLAHALSNDSKDFSQSGHLWREHGDISRLLHPTNGDSSGYRSLLQSETYYQTNLKMAFDSLCADGIGDGSETIEDVSSSDMIDLFVTGTNVHGENTTQFDDAGHLIDVREHRAVFELKHRRDEKNSPFAPENTDALAKLARLTSCFPAAFAPVGVINKGKDTDPTDALLSRWGGLGEGRFYFLDGGVLDNKPFTHTLRAIFSRRANRKVSRRLFYVEPDPESRGQNQQEPQAPTISQAVVSSLIGIPGYESISGDLKLLAEHNSRVEQYDRLVKRIERLRTARTGGNPNDQGTRDLYLRSRLMSLSQPVVQAVFRENGRGKLIPPKERKQAELFIQSFDKFAESLQDQAGLWALLHFDIYFRERRVEQIAVLLREKIFGMMVQDKTLSHRYRILLGILNCQADFYEDLSVTMQELLEQSSLVWTEPPQLVWGKVVRLLKSFLNAEGKIYGEMKELHSKTLSRASSVAKAPGPLVNLEHLEVSDGWSRLKALFRDRKSELIKTPPAGLEIDLSRLADSTPKHSLLIAMDRFERDLIDELLPTSNEVRRVHDKFEEFELRIFPLELIAGIREKQTIKTYRISPIDACKGFSDGNGSPKLTGNLLNHFGAFFKRSWRSNDILWGRLDGVCQLTETLLDRERITEIVNDERWRHKIRERLFQQEHNELKLKPVYDLKSPSLFPHSGAPTWGKLEKWIRMLLSEKEDSRKEALQEESFNEMVVLLIEASQLEIIESELREVAKDALVAQHEWNFLQVPSTKKLTSTRELRAEADNSSPFLWELSTRFHDMTISSQAQELVVTEFMNGLTSEPQRPAASPKSTRMGKYFQNRYRVGSENFKSGIPTLVLLQVFSQALLIASRCILNDLPPEMARRVRKSRLFRYGINLPITSFHGAIYLALRYQLSMAWLLVALVFLSLLLLFIGLTFWGVLIEPQGTLSPYPFLLFIAGPTLALVLILSGLAALRPRQGRGRLFSSWSMNLLIFVTQTVPLIFIIFSMLYYQTIVTILFDAIYIAPHVGYSEVLWIFVAGFVLGKSAFQFKVMWNWWSKRSRNA
ncbi:MAG: patatin-like protein [Isosphaeraceae bacterium]